MKTYNINGIIDVNMYESILTPDVVLDHDDSVTEEQWERFDIKKYEDVVCARAVIELRKLLERLPGSMRCIYVDGSARIISPQYYNYVGDRFSFQVVCKSKLTDAQLQKYLDDFFEDDWNDIIGAQYRIWEFIRGNYSVESFYEESEEKQGLLSAYNGLNQIEELLTKAQELLDKMPTPLQAEMFKYHNSNTTLAHCLRWGEVAARELREDWHTLTAGLEV